MSAMPTSLLQVSYLTESDPTAAIILFVAIAIIIVILTITNIAKNGIGGGSSFSSKSVGAFRLSKGAVKRAAAAYGLSHEQTSLLDGVLRNSRISDPVAALEDTATVDRVFKRSYRDIEKSAETENDAEEGKARLFSIRTTLDSAQGSAARIQSTRRLPDGQAATITGPNGDIYPVKIVTAKGERLAADAPKDAIGTTVKFARGTKVVLAFYAKSSQGYRFETKVVGYEDTPRGPVIILAHSEKIASLPNRRFRRKEVRVSCFFSLVRVEQRMVGRKTEKKTIVDERRAMGTIMDISAGGCAIKSAAAIRTGEYLKVDFDDAQGRTLAALGRTVRTNKSGGIGGIMHIQFMKVPRRALNAINAMVYGYDQD